MAERTSAATRNETYEDPRIARSRALITEAGARIFVARGYPATCVEDVAEAAGVSKRTVYNVFADKEQLFRAILADSIATAESYAERFEAAGREADDPAALVGLARTLAEAIHNGRVVPLRRLLIGEANRFPDLAAEYHRRAPGRVLAAIAETLRALGDRGHLRIEDERVAAEHFAFLAIGPSLDHALFHPVDDDAGSADAVARAELGAEVFLRAYAA